MSAPSAPTAAARSRRRKSATALVGILAVLAILVASLVGTVHAVVLSPDALTSAVAPVGQNPQVQAVIAEKAAAGIADALGVEAKAQEVLGAKVGPLLAPTIARQVEDRLASAITDALASPQFAAAWEQMVHASATAAINVVKGDSTVVTTADGVIYLNILPAIGKTLDALKTQGLIGESVQLPDLSNPSTPAQEAVSRLGSALGISLPANFGQVPIAQTSALQQVQGYVSAFDTVTLVLIVVALALTAATVWLAADRRQTLVRVGIGAALIVGVVPPLLKLADAFVTSMIAAPGMAVVFGAFTEAIVDAVSWPLRVVAVVCLAVAIVGMLAGPGGVRNIAGRPAALLGMALGAVAVIAVAAVVGPSAALIGLALVVAWAEISGRPLIAAPAA